MEDNQRVIIEGTMEIVNGYDEGWAVFIDGQPLAGEICSAFGLKELWGVIGKVRMIIERLE